MDNYSTVLLIRELVHHPGLSQRALSQRSGLSLGKVNKTVRQALLEGLISQTAGKYFVNGAGEAFLKPYAVKNAVILAAGFGSRCVPLTYETPKGLLPVNGRPMIETQIEQLLERGITDITLVVGYMKERFDYLIDRYGVELVYNPEYATKNNIASLLRVKERLGASYLLCADHYMEKNLFHEYEPDSWLTCLYMEGDTAEWCVTQKNKGRILDLTVGGHDEWAIVGPAYFSQAFSAKFGALLGVYAAKPGTQDFYWEDVLREKLSELPIYMNCQNAAEVHEFESMEELRRYDTSYLDNTNNRCMQIIAEVFRVNQSEVTDFFPVKDGMTNKSFVFTVQGKRYVFRIPGEGTEKLIDRKNEKAAYEAVAPLDIADEILYFDAESGVKIAKYYEGSRTAGRLSMEDAKLAMERLHVLHKCKATLPSGLDVKGMMERYDALVQKYNAIRFDKADYEQTKEKMWRLIAFEKALGVTKTLCHGDYNYANVLFLEDGNLRIIDWEYAAMGDPLMDVALYGNYSYMSREQIDECLLYYCKRKPTRQQQARCYMYVALTGFLWCMWCEYKQEVGVEFGDYPLKMYRYAKEYYKILQEEGFLEEL